MSPTFYLHSCKPEVTSKESKAISGTKNNVFHTHGYKAISGLCNSLEDFYTLVADKKSKRQQKRRP